MLIGYEHNQYGTQISRHVCEHCFREFTVCPAIHRDNDNDWRGCMSPDCNSYDESRDADKYFDENGISTEIQVKPIYKNKNYEQ